MKTISQLTLEADKLFSEWIRRRTADGNGIVACVTCGDKDHWKQMHNGHFISRDKFPTRYHPNNCNCQCPRCNGIHNENRQPYSMYMLRNYPAGTIPLLISESMKFTASLDKRQKLNDVIRDMKLKLKRL